MDPSTNGRRRARVIGLTIAIVLLLVALLSDFGQGARDWVADLWNSFGDASSETVSAPSDSTEVADAAREGGDGSVLNRSLSSVPANADSAVAIAAYRGQAAGAGQAKRAGAVGSIDGGPVGAAAGVAAAATGEQPAADGGIGLAEGQDAAGSALALADTGSGGGTGGAAASSGDGFGGGGPFSTVPGGPFVNLTDGPTNGLPHDGPNDNPSSSVPEPGTLLLLASAVVAVGARRWWRG